MKRIDRNTQRCVLFFFELYRNGVPDREQQRGYLIVFFSSLRITYYAILKEIILVFGAVRSTLKKIRSTPNEKKANVRITIANARIELKVRNVAKEIYSVAKKRYAHKKKKVCIQKMAIDPLDKPLPCLKIWSTDPSKTQYKKHFQMLENDREKLENSHSRC